MRTCAWPYLLMFLAFGILTTTDAQATVVLELSKQDLAKSARIIVHGKVVKKRVELSKTTRRIYTIYTLRTMAMLKRDPKRRTPLRTIDVHVLGGTVGKLAMRTPGTTKMKVGEEVVLFLSLRKGRFLVVGLAQGKYSVFIDKKTQQRIVRANRSGLSLARKTRSGLVIRTPTKIPDQPFKGFVSEIKGYLRKR